jgi:hypothetical protein
MTLSSFVNWPAVVAAAVVSLLGLPAAPAAADEWNKVQSRNFQIVGDAGHARLSYIARTLEQSEEITAP